MESALVRLVYHMVRRSAVIIVNGARGLRPIHVTQDALNDIQSPPQCDVQRLAQIRRRFCNNCGMQDREGNVRFRWTDLDHGDRRPRLAQFKRRRNQSAGNVSQSLKQRPAPRQPEGEKLLKIRWIGFTYRL